jgi:hypothetical protein
MTINVEDLGLTKEELAERVVAKIATDLLEETTVSYDEDGDPWEGSRPTKFEQAMKEFVTKRIDAEVTRLAEATVAPFVVKAIERLVIQETNRYGEAKKPPQTFVEYLETRIDTYLKEAVDKDGRCRVDSYSFSPTGTRISHLVFSHIHSEMEKAVRATFSETTKTIAGMLSEAMKTKLEQIAKSMQVSVKS